MFATSQLRFVGRRHNVRAVSMHHGKPFIYCAGALFSPYERIAALEMAEAVERAIARAATSIPRMVFLPFRDSQQVDIVGPNRAAEIFRRDLEKLNQSCLLVARLDGLIKDAGVAMEIGYAYGKRIPVGVVSTSFIWEGNCFGDYSWIFDPIIKLMSTVSHSKFGLAHHERTTYREANLQLELSTLNQFASLCVALLDNHDIENMLEGEILSASSVYIDFGGSRSAWAHAAAQIIKEDLDKFGIASYIATRYKQTSISAENMLMQSSRNDIDSAIRATYVVISAECAAVDCGSAAILGLCRALDKNIILINTTTLCYHGDGQQRMITNLMLEQAATTVTHSFPQAISEIHRLWREAL